MKFTQWLEKYGTSIMGRQDRTIGGNLESTEELLEILSKALGGIGHWNHKANIHGESPNALFAKDLNELERQLALLHDKVERSQSQLQSRSAGAQVPPSF